jgi:hypothetical protein
MTAHVISRRISTHDYFWVIKDFYDTTLETGHSRSSDQAKKDARACRNWWIAHIAEQSEAQAKLPKRTNGGKCDFSANQRRSAEIRQHEGRVIGKAKETIDHGD